VTRFTVLTLFPDMVEGGLAHGVLSRAVKAGIIEIRAVNIRDFAVNRYGQVDDTPCGGGAGMVMAAKPVCEAYESVYTEGAGVIYLTPRGGRFEQKDAARLSKMSELILICGHYEGVDERAIDIIRPEEISIGDFVLTGGELAAMAVIDSVARLIPGVLNNPGSVRDESFSAGLLEYPQYTKPRVFRGREVPEALISGHHAKVREWRRLQAIEITKLKRPDLYEIFMGSGNGENNSGGNAWL
jgi:tRNA (guanine37-N1)-methyltransferase